MARASRKKVSDFVILSTFGDSTIGLVERFYEIGMDKVRSSKGVPLENLVFSFVIDSDPEKAYVAWTNKR